MRVAVTSQNFRTITGHAGKARRFLLYDLDAGRVVGDARGLDLPKDVCLHENFVVGPHTLDGSEVLITGGCGNGLVQRLAARGVRVLVTGETDPATAVAKFAAGEPLAPVVPTAHGHEQHGHHHEHGYGCGGQ